uniref:CUB domain-containing protein n=1 Tax=Parastrongyloides trichosuri TaxID=131310 RepID=A0A0N4ZEQ5_PARTI
MVCECIPPPPIFDLEPPPDPSYIFDLISDEPLSLLRQAQLESCDYIPVLEVLDISKRISTISPEALPILLLGLLFLLVTVLIIIIIVIKYKRSKQTTRTNSIKKLSSGPNTFDMCSGTLFCTPSPQYNVVLNNSSSSGESNCNWSIPYERTGHGKGNVYGSNSNNDILGYQMSYSGGNAGSINSRNILKSSHSTTLRFPITEEGYCTVRHYDDMNGYASPDVTMNTFRKPPPSCPPPPPPGVRNVIINSNGVKNNQDNISSCSSGTEKELENIHHETSSISPVISFTNQQIKYPHGGRESGYGTGPSRLQNNSLTSPRTPIKNKKKFVSPNTSLSTGQEGNMTYV